MTTAIDTIQQALGHPVRIEHDAAKGMTNVLVDGEPRITHHWHPKPTPDTAPEQIAEMETRYVESIARYLASDPTLVLVLGLGRPASSTVSPAP